LEQLATTPLDVVAAVVVAAVVVALFHLGWSDHVTYNRLV
jgi:hypothetical protein